MNSPRILRAITVCALAVVAASDTIHGQSAQVSTGATNPPPSFTTFIPVCYNSVNGNVRYVNPWGVLGISEPNCTPPAPWNVNPPYDSAMCNTGGSFDCRANEFYNELQTAGAAGPTIERSAGVAHRAVIRRVHI